LDVSKLVCKRDPAEVEYADEEYYGNSMVDIVYQNPEVIADLLEQHGFTVESLKKELGDCVPF
jgi:hypothetical protein